MPLDMPGALRPGYCAHSCVFGRRAFLQLWRVAAGRATNGAQPGGDSLFDLLIRKIFVPKTLAFEAA